MKRKIVKQKPLSPTLREKKRYVVYEVLSDSQISQKASQRLILQEFKELAGNLGLGKAGLLFLKDWEEYKGILRINNKYLDHLRAALCNIQEKDTLFRSVAVSGVLKQARIRFSGGR